MSTSSLARVAAKKAADVVAKIKIGEAAQTLLRPDMTPRQYLDLLIQKGLVTDAVRFLAHAIPRPEAVWWAILCARAAAVPPAALPPPQAAALSAAEKWLQDPSEDNRRGALGAAQAAGTETPAGLAALGVFFSGGSLTPASVPAIPAGEQMTADVLTGSIAQASVPGSPDKATERLAGFLAKGVEVANGTSRWPTKK